MPKINLGREGGTIVYDQEDWLGGQDDSSAGLDRRKLRNGLAFVDQADPLRRIGYISPSPLPVDATNITAITTYLRNAVISGDSAYAISGGSLLHQLTNLASTGTVTNAGSWPHTMNNAAAWTVPVGDDICNYYTLTGGAQVLRTFYSLSYSEGGTAKWNIGIYNQVATTFDDDFMSTVPATPLAAPYLTGGSGFPHPLIVGDDDVMYIGDRNFVHAYDGQLDKFYPAVLTLPQGWVVTCFAKKNDFKLAIGAYFSPSGGANQAFNLGSAKVWQWNYLDLDPDYAYDLHDNYVSEIFNWNGTIAAFTSGRKTLTQRGNYKLQYLNGLNFEVLQTYTTGALPIRGGVDVVEKDIYWSGAGKIYYYAQIPGSNKYTFGNVFGNGDTTSGMLKLFTSIFNIHFSDGASTGLGLRSLPYGTTFNAGGNAYGEVSYPVWPARKRGRLKQVDIDFMETVAAGDGRYFRLNTQLDSDGGTVTLDDIQAVTNIRKEVKDNRADGTALGDFSALQPQLIWTSGTGTGAKNACPTIDKVVYHFEYINIDP